MASAVTRAYIALIWFWGLVAILAATTAGVQGRALAGQESFGNQLQNFHLNLSRFLTIFIMFIWYYAVCDCDLHA